MERLKIGWKSQEGNMIFPWNKKVLKLCLKNFIFRSYYTLAEVAFILSTYELLILVAQSRGQVVICNKRKDMGTEKIRIKKKT